ncbi:restriction endonuclease subunit S [Streptomyces sp. H27-S2]|uniref:restriction endonuclease subunit S n=1 Tax=Streptomyces antarcticus TaxID=2996458 RepID=UPI002270CB00|nr:restriction endonuclease subunit S [Streptomyces sp. H27-S2]MCY0951586.1 restriction endonuclease subunit S [Streptomyces sp. H27-S2]
MTGNWKTETVEACLQRITLPRVKLPTSSYKQSGKYPIIDQSQADIAGWTDGEDGVIDEQLPLIVFGDHSRTLKYIDTPFVRGADGTQILKPRLGIDPLFFFYALRSINLESRGYNRHFTILKEQLVPVPEQSDQVRIAQALKQVEDGIRLQERKAATLKELKGVALHELFARGVRGEPQKETEFGQVPEGWVVEELGDSHTVQTGGTPSRRDSRYWDGGTIPWVKTAEVSYSTITETSEHITVAALKETSVKLFPAGTLLLAMYGQGVTRGKVGKLGTEATCNQACAALRCPDGSVAPDYLYYFLEWQYENIRARAHGGQQQNLSLDIVRTIPIAYPRDLNQQQEIAALLKTIDQNRELQRAKLELLKELFDRMLHDLMTGNITVDDLFVPIGLLPEGNAE